MIKLWQLSEEDTYLADKISNKQINKYIYFNLFAINV